MKKILISFFALFLITTIACKEEILLPELIQGSDGVSTIFAFDVLAPTDEHTNGGYVMLVGGDLNKNSILDTDEVQATVPIWNGNDGINGTSGVDGLNGADGTTITISNDGYWVLDGVLTEIKALGVDGTDGQNGVDGKSPIVGDDGYWYVWNNVSNSYETTNIKAEGASGKDGQTPDLYLVTVDLPSTSGHENGGTLVTTVWDKNADQLISDDEIVGAYTVWNGNNGSNGQDGQDGSDGQDGTDGVDGKSPFVENGYWYYWSSDTETWVNGGKSQGADGQDGTDGVDGQNGSNGQDGIDGKSPYIQNGYWYFWNGTVWVNGGKSQGIKGDKGDKGDTGGRGTIVGYTVETALNCSTNGYRITMTIDEGLPTEYQQWFEVCDGRVGDTGAQGVQGPKGDNGIQGDNGLTVLVEFSEKVDGCFTITKGLDVNKNSVLDVNEVTDTREICDGEQGEQGTAGVCDCNDDCDDEGDCGFDCDDTKNKVLTQEFNSNYGRSDAIADGWKIYGFDNAPSNFGLKSATDAVFGGDPNGQRNSMIETPNLEACEVEKVVVDVNAYDNGLAVNKTWSYRLVFTHCDGSETTTNHVEVEGDGKIKWNGSWKKVTNVRVEVQRVSSQGTHRAAIDKVQIKGFIAD